MNKKRFMAFVACAFALVAAFALVGCGGTSAQTAGSAAGSASAGSDDSADIKTLTGKPARRWEELVDKVIWLLVGAVLAYALGQLGL